MQDSEEPDEIVPRRAPTMRLYDFGQVVADGEGTITREEYYRVRGEPVAPARPHRKVSARRRKAKS